ncbi:MAG TPA: hypothetical protein PLR06_09640 [Cyclobacteriaceae bacterium]|nr:hypothetical protein [Cyclobacteriaceae bacterium]
MKWILALVLFLPFSPAKHKPVEKSETAPDPAGLFDSSEVINLELSGNLNTIFKDLADQSEYHPATLSYKKADSSVVSIELKVKTRGHFRKKAGNCFYPPLLLNFPKENVPADSFFAGQEKLKLVTPCKGDEYVIREYLVYKLYNLVTEKSFRARLVRVVYDDTEKHKTSKPLYGILLEDENQMAARNGSVIEEKRLLLPQQVNFEIFHKMAVFEYLIANTDWSVKYRQNVKLINNQKGDLFIPVPYDFDHSGMVSAPYAKPATELEMSSVRQRRYRGYCLTDLSQLNDAFALFDELKSEIYKTYSENPLLDEKYKKNTARFLDEFYQTIHDAGQRQREFGYPCREDGTGNVVIKGYGKY